MAASRLGSVCCSRLTSLFCVMGTYHRPLVVLLLPFIITLPLYRTSTCNPYFPTFTSQPALHSCTIDNNECLTPGNTCAYPAFTGSSGTSMNPSCVLLTFSPFAAVTTVGFAVIVLLVRGGSTCRKRLLAPESSIAHSRMFAKVVSIVESRILGGSW